MPRMAAGPPIEASAGGTAPETTRSAVTAALGANCATAPYHCVQVLAGHLTDCRKTLGGGFVDLMMLAVPGRHLLQGRQKREACDTGATERIWIPALRLPDVTGVPRESVRRKLKQLADRGRVTQGPARGWGLAGSFGMVPVRIGPGDFGRRGLQRLGKLMTALLPLLPNREAPAG